jgi:hypothetical protein
LQRGQHKSRGDAASDEIHPEEVVWPQSPLLAKRQFNRAKGKHRAHEAGNGDGASHDGNVRSTDTAMRFAWRKREEWTSLSECLRANGGIAGCAAKRADEQPMRTPPCCVRVCGEGRFPKIPLFVGVEMLDKYGDFR